MAVWVDLCGSTPISIVRFGSSSHAGWESTADMSTSRTSLRQLANRLVGILHGCLKTRTVYDETTAWSMHTEKVTAA